MSRIAQWFQHHERRLFFLVNHNMKHAAFDRVMETVTHLGGATATIAATLAIALFAHGSWKTAGIQSCIALAVSHLPVSLIKRKYPRLRPYMTLPEARTGKNPLTDHSFPSGHTTAVFSVIIPFVCLLPLSGLILLPLALTVGLSRIYLGLHYPSDCAVGCMIGTGAALATVAFF